MLGLIRRCASYLGQLHSFRVYHEMLQIQHKHSVRAGLFQKLCSPLYQSKHHLERLFAPDGWLPYKTHFDND